MGMRRSKMRCLYAVCEVLVKAFDGAADPPLVIMAD
jgi:hypothetical protein